MLVKFKKLHPDATAPVRAHDDDACYDVACTSVRYFGGLVIYGTGLALEIPDGYRMDCRPRSSIYKTGLVLSNSTGTIDSGYRGEIMAVFYVVDPDLPKYRVGDRIMQIKLEKVQPLEFEEAEQLSETERGAGGFGSTGR